ncbi:MAG TPA: hypothetical protein VFG05_04180 [Methylocella sp.]|nr:hypothetical protein [Methylocella sp.]
MVRGNRTAIEPGMQKCDAPLLNPMNCFSRLAGRAALASFCLTYGTLAFAQAPKSYGSPLDTLMNTRLWADVPEAKDFVRASRPPSGSLSYQPLTGVDPERPKPRTEEELKALESELNDAAARNSRRGGNLGRPRAAVPAKTAVR